MRYALRDPTDWRKGRSPFAQRNRATEEQKREGWEMAVYTKKIIATVLHNAQRRQSGIATSFAERAEWLYG